MIIAVAVTYSAAVAAETQFRPVRTQAATIVHGTEQEGAASGPSKISASLRMTMHDINRAGAALFAKPGASVASALAIEQAKDGSIVLPVFIRTDDVAATREQVIASGGEVTVVAGDVLVAHVPAVAIEALAGRTEIRRIEGSAKSKPMLDAARREAKVDQVQAGIGIKSPLKGQGVIVGILDSGIDLSHPDFKNASGQTRILSLWDETVSGKPPAGFTRGYECTSADINNGTCPERDTNGHGTHVAGIAAGNARGSGGLYLGMAPEADLVIVKGGEGSFDDTNVVEGISYIFGKAQSLGKPAVVNLSLGGHFSPHDGTSLYEAAVSNLIARGKLIAAANGNEGGTRIHVGYDVKGTSYDTGYSSFILPDDDADRLIIDGWYDSGAANIGIQVLDKSTAKPFFATNAIAPGSSLAETPITNAGVATGLTVTIETGTSPSGSKEAAVLIRGSRLSNYAYEVYTYGSGHLDAWIATGGEFTKGSDAFTIPGDTNYTVGTPATAANVVAVGSYVTKTNWVDIDGASRGYSNETLGNISSFSSVGPTRDGRRRPIVSAPGQAIFSALSNASINSSERPYYLSGGLYRVEQGTSMSTPLVAGIIALLFQANPALSAGDVYTLLRGSAVKDNFTGSSANNTWGDGKVDAMGALKAAGFGGSPTGPGPSVCTPSSTTICLAGGRFAVSVQFRDQGQLKNATAIKYTDASGLFWFFGPDNIEILMKVLNACGLNNKIWVFTAATTNVEYHLKVVDTKNGTTKTYDTVAGPPAPAITDTQAFNTCP